MNTWHSKTTRYLFFLLLFSHAASAQTDYARLYWSDYDANSIERINLDGSGRQTLVANSSSAGNGPTSLEVDVPHQKIYWQDNGTYEIKRANFDGTGVGVFIAAPGYAPALCVDPAAGKLYWPDYDANSIESINLDGSGRQTVISNAANTGGGPVCLAIDKTHGKAYWLDNQTVQIKRANLDGTGREVFVTNPGYTAQITLDAAATRLYWGDQDANSIERINLDGSNRQTVVANATDPGSVPYSIALDETNNKIFWLDQNASNIRSANLDGTGKQVFLSNPGFANNMIIPKQSIPLPIRLISFTGNTAQCTPSIEWTTADAVNFNKFELQRSENGSPFATIASLPYIRDKNSYQYTDKGTGNGDLLYRLKMVDLDGSSTFSAIISARVDCSTPAAFSVYPNPVKANAYLTTDKMLRQIDLISMSGQVLWSRIPPRQTGTIPLTFDKTVAKGMYILKATATDGTVRQVSVLKE
ncbi:MAG TPA: T9SS type A sorting domain-containing protein [Puia sp.]|jgi:hypothetical protein|nr:T9SS type A sorting domain-containing protein [Puia sp.]